MSFYVPFNTDFNATDGTTTTAWADGKLVIEYPPPLDTAPEFQRATAMQRRVRYAVNNTEVQFFFNQTVAEFRNGTFFRYIVPPKNFLINIDNQFNPDGSQTINYSNGTSIFIGTPPVKDETPEQFAQRIVRTESFNGTKTVTYANGTVAVFVNEVFSFYRVAPQQLFVSRKVDNLPDGTIREIFSNGTIRTSFAPPSSLMDELAKSRFVVFEDLNNLKG